MTVQLDDRREIRRQIGNKIHGDMCPGAFRYGQWLQKARSLLVRHLITGADQTCGNKSFNILGERWPPIESKIRLRDLRTPGCPASLEECPPSQYPFPLAKRYEGLPWGNLFETNRGCSNQSTGVNYVLRLRVLVGGIR